MRLVICLISLLHQIWAYSYSKPVDLLGTSQYHDVAADSYLTIMFNMDSIPQTSYLETTINSILSINMSHESSTNSEFDFIAFSTSNQNSISQYQCYVTSVSIDPTISNCSISCQVCNQSCLEACYMKSYNNSSPTCCCSGCPSEPQGYNITLPTSSQSGRNSSNQSFYPILVFDNSQFLGPNKTNNLSLILQYYSNIDISLEYEIMLYVAIGISAFVLGILVGFCIWLYRKVDHTNKELILFQKSQGKDKQKDA